MLPSMVITRRLRRWVSGGVLLAVLFMQLATAVYACPQLAKSLEYAAMAGMQNCEGMSAAQMDDAQPLLCKAHCDKEAQSAASTVTPDVQSNLAATTLLMGIVVPSLAAPLSEAAPGQPMALGRPPSAPPLYLSLLVLRN